MYRFINPLKKEFGACQIKVKPQLTLAQRFTDWVSRAVRSWTFVIGQLIFIALWIGFNLWRPDLAFDDKSFNILRLVLTIEASFTGSILLMTQHRQSQKDRNIIYNDYIVDCNIYKEVKEIRKQLDKQKAGANTEETKH